MAKRKWSKLTRVLVGTTIGTLAVAGGFLGLFLSGASVLGLAPMIVADIALVGMGATLVAGLVTAVRAVVRFSGRFGNKNKEFKTFHQMDKLQNSTERSKSATREAMLKNAIKYANTRLKHIKLNSLPVTGRRFFFNGNEKQNIYKNHLEALNFAKTVYATAEKRWKLRKTEKEIDKYTRLLEKLEQDTTPLELKYTWTRTVQDQATNAVIPDHRVEIACMKSETLTAFKLLAKETAINKSYGNAVRLKYNQESGYLSPYACFNDTSKMENVELLLCKEAIKISNGTLDGQKMFPMEIERIDLKDSKSTVQRFKTVEDLERYVLTLEKAISPEKVSAFKKFAKKSYLTRDPEKVANAKDDPAKTPEGDSVNEL